MKKFMVDHAPQQKVGQCDWKIKTKGRHKPWCSSTKRSYEFLTFCQHVENIEPFLHPRFRITIRHGLRELKLWNVRIASANLVWQQYSKALDRVMEHDTWTAKYEGILLKEFSLDLFQCQDASQSLVWVLRDAQFAAIIHNCEVCCKDDGVEGNGVAQKNRLSCFFWHLQLNSNIE